jgi:hypothetical protein
LQKQLSYSLFSVRHRWENNMKRNLGDCEDMNGMEVALERFQGQALE